MAGECYRRAPSVLTPVCRYTKGKAEWEKLRLHSGPKSKFLCSLLRKTELRSMIIGAGILMDSVISQIKDAFFERGF